MYFQMAWAQQCGALPHIAILPDAGQFRYDHSVISSSSPQGKSMIGSQMNVPQKLTTTQPFFREAGSLQSSSVCRIWYHSLPLGKVSVAIRKSINSPSTPKGARVVPFKIQSEGNGLRSLQMTADQLLFATHHLSLTNETVYAGSMGSFSARPPSRNHTWFTGGLPWKGLPGISDTIKCKPTKNHLLAGYTYCYLMLKATHLQIR